MELRFGLRDPHILGYALWMPLFLYPVLIFATFQILAVREGRSVAQKYTIAVAPEASLPSAPAGGPSPAELLDRLRMTNRLSVREGDVPTDRERILDYLRMERIDGVVTFRSEGAKVTVELIYRGVAQAEGLVRRFERTIDRYRTWYDKKVLRAAGAGVKPLQVSYVNAASSREMGEFILARLLPVTLVIFLGTGAFYTAIDVTAGERERGTFETTLLLPASRAAVVLGKYAYVLAMAMLAAAVNFLSLSLTLGHAFTLLGQGLEIRVSLPPGALGVVFASLVALGLAICPLMMGLAFLTRSFREAQSYVGPIYALLIVPIAAAALPGMRLTPALALVPMLNVTVGMREVIEGKPPGLPFAVAIAETLLLGAFLVMASARLLGRDEARLGLAEGGSLLRAIGRHLRAASA